MINLLPNLNNKIKLCIVCEGHEEYDYIQTLINLNIFNNKYDIKPINAGSNSSIFPFYQDLFANQSYDLVLIFCDTDKDTSYYEELKEKINKHHNQKITDDILIFANPCTMQIILSHFSDDVSLQTQNKKKNGLIIESLTSVKDYDAHNDQRAIIMSKITKENYLYMKKNIASISIYDMDKPSSNILKFLNLFESNNYNWIDNIKNKFHHDI